MNKLTEIKQAINVVENPDKYTMASFLINVDKVNENYTKWLPYLLSLLEEKDKALTFYADERSYEEIADGAIPIYSDYGLIARKALNTSSNNEGEK